MLILGFGIGYLALLVDPLLTLQRWVMEGNVPYEQTLFTVHNSMLALQLREVGSRQPGEIDAFMLRILLLIFNPK